MRGPSRLWKAERLSWFMTNLPREFPGQDAFDTRMRQTDYADFLGSEAGRKTIAENAVGRPFDPIG
ncbi:hypothetical protein RSP799_08690 [Ralstonia solanacearum]|nr:hypothetical protein RSP799_08690 [Ralstonia solanacearum]